MAFKAEDYLIDLRGKKYLEVKWRLVWFREEHQDYTIQTELVNFDPENHHAIFKATISNNEQRPLSSGYGSESARDFRDYIEKAETKAVGRALAMLGYGTQFAPEMEEGERIVDAPISPKRQTSSVCEKCGQEVTNAVVAYCQHNFNGHVYCPSCQKKSRRLENA
jgi:transposase-like protein